MDPYRQLNKEKKLPFSFIVWLKSWSPFIFVFFVLFFLGGLTIRGYNKPYFLPKNSDWHQKQGINYEYNPAVAAISPALHSLFTLQAYSIQLTKEEFYAILSTKDRTQLTGEASFYGKSDLTTLLQAAISFTITSLEGKTSVLD
jgi:hypothetical protein